MTSSQPFAVRLLFLLGVVVYVSCETPSMNLLLVVPIHDPWSCYADLLQLPYMYVFRKYGWPVEQEGSLQLSYHFFIVLSLLCGM